MQVFVPQALAGRSAGQATHGALDRGLTGLGALLAILGALLAILGATLLLLGLPAVAMAHGDVPHEPTLATVWEGWSFEADIWLPIVAAAAAYWLARRRVDRQHPGNPVPRWRMWSWMAGLGALVLALTSPIEHFDTTLFSAHMVQHLLLMLVAAPLLVLAAPITLLLRISSSDVRRRWILPVLHSRFVRAFSHPLVAWCAFALVMWFAHFSSLFDAALEDESLHRLEHVLFITTALLFWWPVIGADPSPHRMSYPARLFYLALGMPLSSFLGMVIFSAQTVLYLHYATLEREWGMTPLEDQALAGGIMWAGGDIAFVVALLVVVAAWLRHEEREDRREDARLARATMARGAAARASADGIDRGERIAVNSAIEG